MLKTRDHNLLLFGIGLLFCTVAANITYVSIAQNQTDVDKGSAVKRTANDAAQTPVESDNLEMKAASSVAAMPSDGDPSDDPMPAADPPARSVTITGRALDARDRGRLNAVISLYEADGTLHSATSDRSGNFRFENIADGQQIVLSAGRQPDPKLDLTLQIKGETRVFWRTPNRNANEKSGER